MIYIFYFALSSIIASFIILTVTYFENLKSGTLTDENGKIHKASKEDIQKDYVYNLKVLLEVQLILYIAIFIIAFVVKSILNN